MLAREGPCCTRMFTISMSPFQAARCNGQLPELSGIIVEAPHFSRRETASLEGEEGEEERKGRGKRRGARVKELFMCSVYWLA